MAPATLDLLLRAAHRLALLLHDALGKRADVGHGDLSHLVDDGLALLVRRGDLRSPGLERLLTSRRPHVVTQQGRALPGRPGIISACAGRHNPFALGDQNGKLKRLRLVGLLLGDVRHIREDLACGGVDDLRQARERVREDGRDKRDTHREGGVGGVLRWAAEQRKLAHSKRRRAVDESAVDQHLVGCRLRRSGIRDSSEVGIVVGVLVGRGLCVSGSWCWYVLLRFRLILCVDRPVFARRCSRPFF